jgi:hypothetical protein
MKVLEELRKHGKEERSSRYEKLMKLKGKADLDGLD